MNTINIGMYKQQGIAKYPIWHPYSNINQNSSTMIKMKKGEGSFIFDENNKRYLDATSGLWNMSLGYSNRNIKMAIKEQLDSLPYCSLFEYSNDTVIKAANMILQECNCDMEKIFFTCSGSESIELALKLARKYWNLLGKEKKRRVISIKESYHGTYYGSMGVSGSEIQCFSEFGSTSDTLFLDYALEGDGFDECKYLDIEQYIVRNCDEIACVVLESILASEGVKILHSDYLEWIYRVCKKNNILIIVDEIALGFYRTGTAFYYQQTGIIPDLICMSKGINAGYLPLGAVAISHEICETYSDSNNYLAHGSTQGGNVTACAACVAAIEEYRKKNVECHVKKMGTYILCELRKKIDEHPNVADIRGKGLLIGIDLVEDKISKKPLSIHFVKNVQTCCRENGLLVYTSKKGLTLLPTLSILKKEANLLIEKLSQTMEDIYF